MSKPNDDKHPVIRMTGVVLGYRRPLLGPLDLDIEKGDFWGIIGPNGAGKTTFVRTLTGLLSPFAGRVEYPSKRPRFGYVPQRHVLSQEYPLSSYDVVVMGRTGLAGIFKRDRDSDREVAMREMERMGVNHLAGRSFSSCSAGQQQKILVARALASAPDLLILDEPTSGMDLPGESDFLDFLKRYHRETSMTVLMIGHQIGNVASVVDHLCLMNPDRGVLETGRLQEMMDPSRFRAVFGRDVDVGSGIFTGAQHVGLRESGGCHD